MKKTKIERLYTKIERLYTIESKLYNRYDNKKYQLTKARIHKIQIEILNEVLILLQIAQSDELFFIEVEQALKNGWAGSLQETSNFTDLLEEARNGDAEACGMLKNVFKPNLAFKKETARFANV